MVDLIGGGGHASVLADVSRRSGHGHIRVWAEEEVDLSRLGSGVELRPLAELSVDFPVLLGFGDIGARREMRRRFPLVAPPLVDPSAILGTGVHIGAGSVVLPGCIVNPNATIGEDAILNTGCIVEHDCTVGRNSHLSPGVRLAGAAHVGDDVHVGTGAIILPGITVGSGAVIGAGAVVIRNVPPGARVAGVPAKPIRQA